jgi:hypothetical protein
MKILFWHSMQLFKQWIPLCAMGCNVLYGADFSHWDEKWNLIGDAVFMRRSHINDKPLVKDTNKDRSCPNECDDFTVISNRGLVKHFHFDPGFRATLIYCEDVKNSFEGVFLWIRPWHGTRHANGNQSLFFPFDSTSYAFDYYQASEAKAEYHSRFWDAELNYWHHFSPRYVDFFSLSGVIGMRYFHLNESFELTFVKPPDTSDYTIHTENDVFGFQLGLNLQMAPTNRLSWDFTVKLGAMVNRAKQKNWLQDYNNTVILRHFERQKWQRGLFADFLGQVGYQFKESFNLHIGYEFLNLSGVALAPEQTSGDTDSGAGKKVDSDGFIFIYGFWLGAAFSF